MSSKIAFLLSMIFALLFIALGTDMMSIQFAYNDLGAKSVSISYLISSYGTLDTSIINNIETKYSVEFTCLENCSPIFGDVLKYKISREIKTMTMSQHFEISLIREAVIGLYV